MDTPQSFGKIMSTLTPRHAIAYDFFNEEATRYGVYEGIRETYEGALSMATDRMVWNVTPERIIERMVTITDEAWGVKSHRPGESPEIGPFWSPKSLRRGSAFAISHKSAATG